ncbi:MAG: peptidylprolyl isomerase [Bacteroidales bacterium]|jgi:peptidyl-prolyl cis-trans isomerase D|nr:peptidylprolyl isomerase [Bacteroidales bacterium]
MAAIQKLRNKSGLITLCIGIALLAFIITGLDPSLFSSQPKNVIAEINEEEYPYESYDAVYQQVDAIYRNNPNMMGNPAQMSDMVYTVAWQQFVDEQLVKNKVHQLGIGVFNERYNVYGICAEEFEDAIMGENIDMEVRQFFSNPQTGQFERDFIANFLTNLSQVREENPAIYEYWIGLEKRLHQNRVAEKLKTMLAKSLYVTTLEAEVSINDRSRKTDVLSVQIPFSSISDDKVSVTDEDILAYYNTVKGKKQYEQETNVDISYVVFDPIATQADVEHIRQNVEGKALDFQNAKNTIAFLNLNSDIKFNPTYYKKGDLPAAIDSFAFAGKINDITPLFEDANMFKITKISDIRFAADSAKVRHILLANANASMERADSIKALLEKGANFEQLVRQYSADSGSVALGGVIDWFKAGQMVQPFQDSSFFGEKGKFYLAPSQYGIHIIEILQQGTKSKVVQVQTLARTITFSSETRKNVNKQAITFVSENRTADQFNAALEKSNTIVKRTATVFENQRSLPGISDSRSVIRWAHQNKAHKNEVSDIFVCGDKFVVAVVTNVHEKGAMSFEALKDQLRPDVVREKKTALIQEQLSFITTNTTIQDIAAKMNASIDTLPNTTFAQQTSVQIGNEPLVFATASTLKEGQLSAPIGGNNGVFVIVPTAIRTEPAGNVDVEKNVLGIQRETAFSNAIMQLLRDKADVKDFRINFF